MDIISSLHEAKSTERAEAEQVKLYLTILAPSSGHLTSNQLMPVL